MPPSLARRYMGQRVTSMPLSTTWPWSGSIMPQVMRKLVVLPAPLGPSRPTISAVLDGEADAIDHLAAAVGFDEPFDFQNGHVSSVTNSECGIQNCGMRNSIPHSAICILHYLIGPIFAEIGRERDRAVPGVRPVDQQGLADQQVALDVVVVVIARRGLRNQKRPSELCGLLSPSGRN